MKKEYKGKNRSKGKSSMTAVLVKTKQTIKKGNYYD